MRDFGAMYDAGRVERLCVSRGSADGGVQVVGRGLPGHVTEGCCGP